MPKIGDVVLIRNSLETGIIISQAFSNSSVFAINQSSYNSGMNVYYVLTTKAKIKGPYFTNDLNFFS